MTILALDTSSKAASCALLEDGRLAGEVFLNIGLTHSQSIMPMVRSLLAHTGGVLNQMDALAVTTGPGSFTGLRIGIASVKGMALADEKPCVAVSTLEALAENLTAFDGVVIPVMDARRSQFYTAAFRCRDGRMTRLEPDEALPLEAVEQRIRRLEGAPAMLVGDGAELCMGLLPQLPGLRIAPQALLHQRASSVALVAARMLAEGKTCTADALEPAYLRLPQAERERLARLER